MMPEKTATFVAACLVGCHLWAVTMFLPPRTWGSENPILGADHPAHAQRVEVYRTALSESGLPWGYDPLVCAGALVRPTQDAGAKPQEIIGVFWPAPAGMVVRVFLLVTAISFPIWPLLAGWLVGMRRNELMWLAVVLLGPAWLYGNLRGFMQWGLSGFTFSAYLSPLVLVLFVRFLERPSLKKYFWASGLLAVQATMHVLGPVVVSVAMVALLVTARSLDFKWRLWAWATPLLLAIVCGFWLLPFVLGLSAPRPNLEAYYPPDLTYLSVAHLLDMISPLRALALGVGCLGAVLGLAAFAKVTSRRMVWAFGLAIGTGLLLKFGGSFVPVIVEMQPARFLLPTFALMCLPAALAAQRCSAAVRIPDVAGATGVAIGLLALAIYLPQRNPETSRTHTDFAGRTRQESPTFLSLPESVPEPAGFDQLIAFVTARTAPTDRLLVQTRVQAEQTILAHQLQREIVGNAYPNTSDRANFLLNSLWGVPLADWKPAELQDALARWKIRWVVAHTPKARVLFEKTLGPGIPLGPYRAYAVKRESDSALPGDAVIHASTNRLEISEVSSEEGLLVIPYRYHPAFECPEGCSIVRFPIKEDPVGFIAVRNPPKEFTLVFAPARLFSASWPDYFAHVEKQPTPE